MKLYVIDERTPPEAGRHNEQKWAREYHTRRRKTLPLALIAGILLGAAVAFWRFDLPELALASALVGALPAGVMVERMYWTGRGVRATAAALLAEGDAIAADAVQA